MKKIFFIFILSLIIYIFYIPSSFAADVIISNSAQISVDNVFPVLVNLNTENQVINATEISISYDNSLVSFVGYKNTFISLWIEPPHIKEGKIYFSGVIPGGAVGLYDANRKNLDNIPLVKLLFKAKKEGIASFSFDETKILKHDGKGSELFFNQKNSQILITKNNLNEITGITDKTKPEPFEIKLVESSFFSKIPRMILFETVDLGSGIKGYQMRIGERKWKNVRSPQVISRSIFSQIVSIKAFDFYGNTRESSIIIPGVIPFRFFSILLLLSLIIFFFRKKLLR